MLALPFGLKQGQASHFLQSSHFFEVPLPKGVSSDIANPAACT